MRENAGSLCVQKQPEVLDSDTRDQEVNMPAFTAGMTCKHELMPFTQCHSSCGHTVWGLVVQCFEVSVSERDKRVSSSGRLGQAAS